MRNSLMLLCLTLTFFSSTQAAVFRRGDKISEQFKQLDLAPEEIDPDVAPLSPNKVQSIDETTDIDNELLEDSDNEIIDESVNEISQSASTVGQAAATTVAPVAVAIPTEAAATPVKDEEPSGLAKYCKCNENHCDCCRTFNLPFIPVKGPGCARMTYLGNEKMSISLKYGDLTLASRTVSSKKARPICVGLPGGYSQFCGRVYGLSKAKENFKACLGFELRADDEVEAALRVSCFKFGPEGLRVADAEPLPLVANKDEDDDDDDIFGFGAGADDEEDEDDYDEDDDEEEEADDDADTDPDYASDDAAEEAPATAGFSGFSLAGLLEELDEDDDEDSKPSSTPSLTTITSLVSAEDATRAAEVSAQSKSEKGSSPAASAVASTGTVSPVAAVATVVNAVADQVTPAPAEITPETTAKTIISKKAKKNKKKKAADTEGDFAYELLNGLLEFFN